MNRLQALMDLCFKLPYQKAARKLTEAEFDVMVEFLEDNADLGHLEFERAVNRMFLDRDRSRTPHWAVVMELLVCANSLANPRTKRSRV